MAFYKKKYLQEMTPWVEGLLTCSISISESDKKNGSPRVGDMIAINDKDSSDMWLVAEKFFKDNYEWFSD